MNALIIIIKPYGVQIIIIITIIIITPLTLSRRPIL